MGTVVDTMADSSNPEACLGHFGLTNFRPGQKEVIHALLARRDCLCIMPTGGGKSLCYQLPAVMRPGVVLVISPLIALMKDQVDGLQTLGLRATFINSSLELGEQQQRLQGMASGQFDLVYVAPERLRSPRFLEALKGVQLQLLAIDEAHCISEWGHDFRPDYARIGQFREKLGFPQTIALTATATPLVRQDVITQLRLKSPEVFITGFARPNLRFEVYEPASARDKDDFLVNLLDETSGPVLIYASTRKRCETLCELLSERQKRPVGLYHAGLLPDDRRSIQDRFMSGKVPVIVATNAFGMGIDKRDLRMVVHYNMPGSLEAYYQEAGRAGRDGLPSRCVLLFTYSDRYTQEFFIDNAYPEQDVVRSVYEFLRLRPEDPIELTLQQIKEQLGLTLSSEGVGVCERLLEKCGVLERLESQQNMAQIKLDSNLPTLVDLLSREAKVQRRVLRALEQEVEDRRGEWVPFYPQKLGAMLDMDRESLNRAIRELTRLPVVDFVPPFRGRAIHMLRRDMAFSQLDIDFSELKRRKAAELEKLDRVIKFAQTRRCRQREILDYFGDPQRFQCGCCDNCRPEMPLEIALPEGECGSDEAVLEAVRIVLSGAARARGRIGKNLLAKMLCGSQSAQITQLRLDKLSTFGLLRDLNQVEVAELVQSLLKSKLLEKTELQPRRPTLQLTELGGQVMRGQRPLPSSFSLPADLLSRLQRRAAKSQPARPPEPIRAVPVAEPRLEAHSQASAEGPNGDRQMGAEQLPAPATERPGFYWTWLLLHDGYSLAECQAIRRLDEGTVLEHLTLAATNGLAVPLDWIATVREKAPTP